jgi:phosphatidylinositol kinase/protein kinase (PI-3  family)
MYGETSELDKAWDIYYGVHINNVSIRGRHLLLVDLQVFKKVEKQLPQLTTLDLQYVSPDLLKARNLELAVPGMVDPGSLMQSSLTMLIRHISKWSTHYQNSQLCHQVDCDYL